MRKKISLLLVLIMTLSLAACGNSQNTDDDQNYKQEKLTTVDRSSLYLRAFRMPIDAKRIYIDVPYWDKLDYNLTNVFQSKDNKFVAVTYSKQKTKDLKQAHDLLWNEFVNNVKASITSVKQLNIEKDEMVVVNGINMYKYTGTVDCEFVDPATNIVYSFSFYITGYSFIYQGELINITGSILNPELSADQNAKDEIYKYVVAAAESARNTEN